MVSGTESSPRPHPEKLSRAPIAAGDYHTSAGEPIAKVSHSEDRRKPSAPTHGPVPHPEKTSLHGEFGVESRGHDYKYSKVDSSDRSHNRSEHIHLNEDAGSIGSSGNKSRRPNTRCKDNFSSKMNDR